MVLVSIPLLVLLLTVGVAHATDDPGGDEKHRFSLLEPGDDDLDAFPEVTVMPDRPVRYASVVPKAAQYEDMAAAKRKEIAARLLELEIERTKLAEEDWLGIDMGEASKKAKGEEGEGERKNRKQKKKKTEHRGKVVRVRPNSLTEGLGYIHEALMTHEKFKKAQDELWNTTQSWLSDITYYSERDDTTFILDLSFTDATWNTTKSWSRWTWDMVSSDTFQDVFSRLRKMIHINSEESRLTRLAESLGNTYKEARAHGMEERKEKYARGETMRYMSRHARAEARIREEELRKLEEMIKEGGKEPFEHKRGARERRRYRDRVTKKHEDQLEEAERQRRENIKRNKEAEAAASAGGN